MECLEIPQFQYGALSEELHVRSVQQRIPISGSLEVTQRCNLRCVHCYVPLARRTGPRQHELSLVEIQHLLDEIAEAGCLWLLLTGGEPFQRKDFLEIYAYARQKGFITTLFTNGTLLTPAIADYLADWRPFSIEISLYGATQATYESVTGVPGSFARCRRGIDLLLERGLPLNLKSVLLTLNAQELEEMQRLAASLGVEYRFDPVINAGLDGCLAPTQYRLTPEEIITIEQHDPERVKLWPLEFEKVRARPDPGQSMYSCSAGLNSFHIDSYGRLSICLTARTPSYDLRQGSFQEGWHSFVPTIRALEYRSEYACLGCELRVGCAQCPAVGLNEYGDPHAISPFFCQLAHLRAGAFDPYYTSHS